MISGSPVQAPRWAKNLETVLTPSSQVPPCTAGPSPLICDKAFGSRREGLLPRVHLRSGPLLPSLPIWLIWELSSPPPPFFPPFPACTLLLSLSRTLELQLHHYEKTHLPPSRALTRSAGSGPCPLTSVRIKTYQRSQVCKLSDLRFQEEELYFRSYSSKRLAA